MQFTPFPEPEPREGGVEIELVVRNARYEEERAALRVVQERNPLALDMLCETFPPTFRTRPEDLMGADDLVISASELTLVVGYPFRGQYVVTVTSPSGFTRAALFADIVRVYTAMFDGCTAIPGARGLSSSRFGITYHRLDDLALERVYLRDHDGRPVAWLSIGS